MRKDWSSWFKSVKRCTGRLGNFTLFQLQKPFTLKCSRVPQSPTLPPLSAAATAPFPSSPRRKFCLARLDVTRWTGTLRGFQCPANVQPGGCTNPRACITIESYLYRNEMSVLRRVLCARRVREIGNVDCTIYNPLCVATIKPPIGT